jgi:hypothetical protein
MRQLYYRKQIWRRQPINLGLLLGGDKYEKS